MAKDRNKHATIATTPGLTNATEAGYGLVPQPFDFGNEVTKHQWGKAMETINHIFTEPASSNFKVQEIDLTVEATAEGGFRFLLSGNLSASTAMRIKFIRKD